MTFLYSARWAFGEQINQPWLLWEDYRKSSKLLHLKELVSLDGMINKSLVEPMYEKQEDWDHFHCDGLCQTNFFTKIEYVLKRMVPTSPFNLLTVVIQPEVPCNDIIIDQFEFVGYDLVDRTYGNSALSNCGGFDETFMPGDLTDKGLISDFNRAYDTQKRLKENNPNMEHADTNVIAIWRHKTIGR